VIELQVSADDISLVAACNAAVVYVARQHRAVHPLGEFDSAGRWYPYARWEHRSCCEGIRCPSRRWPYSLMLHCRTAKHVARLFRVPEKDVRHAAKAFTNLEEPELAVEANEALRYVG
jgi:hypothetical protein